MSESAIEPVVEPGGEPEWSGVTQEQWDQLQQQHNEVLGAVQYLAGLEQQRAAVYSPQGNQEQQAIDPFGDQFGDQLRGLIRSELAPFQQFQVETQLAEAEERAMDILSNLASEHGDADLSLARMRAEAHLPAMQQQYGFTPKAAEAALAAGYREQKQYEKKMYADSVARHSNQIATLAGAPGEPGSTYTVGVQQRTMPDYTKGGTVTQRFFGPNKEV